GQVLTHRVIDRNGRRRWFEAVGRIIPWEGDPAWQISVIDITERKEFEDALQESEKKFRDLVEGSLQGIVVLRRSKPLFCNLAYARLLGYERAEDVMALPALAVHVPERNRGQAEDIWERALQGEFNGQIRKREMIDRHGHRKWFETMGQMIQWEGEPAWQLM